MYIYYEFRIIKKCIYLDLFGFNKFIRIGYASYVEFVQSIV